MADCLFAVFAVFAVFACGCACTPVACGMGGCGWAALWLGAAVVVEVVTPALGAGAPVLSGAVGGVVLLAVVVGGEAVG